MPAGPVIEFTPLTAADLPRVQCWKNAPHARRWFGGGTLAEIAAEYLPRITGDGPTRAFIMVVDGRAVGLIESVRMGDHPDLQPLYGVDDPETANCDVLIGEADAVHRGLGAGIVRAFTERVLFADPRCPACVIDPVPDNAIAIRCYEKAGFRFLRALPEDGEGNGLYLMELRREELFAPPREPDPFHVRPARPSEVDVAHAIDDDACAAYAEVGCAIDLPDDHPYLALEHDRWLAAARAGRMLFACAPGGEPVGLLVLDSIGGVPHLEQVSVQRAHARHGIGRALVERAQRWSVRAGELWLTTYEHVRFNAPFYERLGFARSADTNLSAEQRAILAEERSALPAPERRIAMLYRHRAAERTST